MARRFGLHGELTKGVLNWLVEFTSTPDMIRPMKPDHDVTRLLKRWSDGDLEALDTLIPLVFDDLRRIARACFQRESPNHILQPTALVSELYLLLRGQKKTQWENRAQFFTFASGTMRHLLVDSARRRKAKKRGGGAIPIPLELSEELASETNVDDLIAIDQALEQLARHDPRQAQTVEMRYFSGLQVKEIAELMGISEITVKRDWRTAKHFLYRHMKAPRNEDPEKE